MTVSDDYVEMEMDALNQHECMASLTALLKHMQRNNIVPDIQQVRVTCSLRVLTDSHMPYVYITCEACILNLTLRSSL